MTTTETRLVGATVVVLDEAGTIIPDGEVAYSGSALTYVGARRGPGGREVSGRVIMPGIVNAHTHSGMMALRGLSDDKDLASWLGDMRAIESRMTAADHHWALKLAMVEMLRSGTIGFIDMFRWDAALLGDVRAAGMRVNAAPGVFGYDAVGYPAASADDGRAVLALTEALAADFAGDDLVRVSFGPHAVYTCGPAVLQDVAARAARAGIGVHVHLSEDATEVDGARAQYGATPIAHAQAQGLFEVPVHVAHATKATDADIAILARHGATVSHNPVSNLKLGSGIPPIPAMLRAGVRVALGTDSVASNNTLDMFEEIKTGALIQRGQAENAQATRALDYLRMATSGGSTAAGFGGGELIAGAPADLIMVRTDTPRGTPMNSAESFLAFAATGADVTDVVIAGADVMRDGLLLTLDEAEIRAAVAASHARITTSL